jgi:hypothetical protein
MRFDLRMKSLHKQYTVIGLVDAAKCPEAKQQYVYHTTVKTLITDFVFWCCVIVIMKAELWRLLRRTSALE